MRLQSPSIAGMQSFDFLTSNFGGRLPRHPVSVRLASPIDGCISSNSSKVELDAAEEGSVTDASYALLVHRGGCRFDIKAKYAQELGTR
jgi:hypothetical protein